MNEPAPAFVHQAGEVLYLGQRLNPDLIDGLIEVFQAEINAARACGATDAALAAASKGAQLVIARLQAERYRRNELLRRPA